LSSAVAELVARAGALNAFDVAFEGRLSAGRN
jgi:hypothetical protein